VEGNVNAYPISPVAGVVTICLAVEVVHASRHPVACAQEALAKVQQRRSSCRGEVARLLLVNCCEAKSEGSSFGGGALRARAYSSKLPPLKPPFSTLPCLLWTGKEGKIKE